MNPHTIHERLRRVETMLAALTVELEALGELVEALALAHQREDE